MKTAPGLFESHLTHFFRSALKMVVTDPEKFMFFLSVMNYQRKAARKRKEWLARDIGVPPVMIMSITKRCNLFCKGCYSFALGKRQSSELPADKYAALFREAGELGISVIMLAGGEPLVRKDVMLTAGENRDILFPFFTNGLLLDEDMMNMISMNRNLIPLISIEGEQQLTDERRGDGVFLSLMGKMQLLKSRNLFFGSSITITSENIYTVTSNKYISELVSKGCGLFVFVEYVPADGKSQHLVLKPEHKAYLINRTEILRRSKSALFIGFPGNEDKYEGCLAAGRGFVHINPEGQMEPCPFAPFSDVNVNENSIREGLKSDLLKMIRENHFSLTESNGGCALWNRKDWVESLTTQAPA
ncbi:MAG: radical SAM/SPASM domain-containing protein [Bacteroidales bacterium]